jgi:hypothetical protein
VYLYREVPFLERENFQGPFLSAVGLSSPVIFPAGLGFCVFTYTIAKPNLAGVFSSHTHKQVRHIVVLVLNIDLKEN